MKNVGYQITQRAIDLLFAGTALVLLSPLLLVLAILVRVKLGSPIFFTQVRPGWKEKPFRVYKFRTMVDALDINGNPLPDSERMTKFGKFLRALSLDELPQLWNVLNGSLSLVGPRPLLSRYLGRYTPEQRRRHEVKPGITGWAQINGRNALTWEQKFAYDLWYVEHQSLALNFKILWKTAAKVIKRSDVSAAGHETMPEFFGSQFSETH